MRVRFPLLGLLVVIAALALTTWKLAVAVCIALLVKVARGRIPAVAKRRNQS